MDSKNESIILQSIKFGPILFIIFFSIIISLTLYINYKKTFEEDKKLIQNEFINANKKLVKVQVNQVYNYIIRQQEKTENTLKENLKKRTYEAYSIAMNIYNKNKHLDENIVKKMIHDALSKISFNHNRGYFFIYSLDYKCILLPPDEKKEGTNFYNYQDSKGTYLIRDMIKGIEERNESFLTWWYSKPNDMTKHYKKLGFYKKFEPFNWFIGTGEYLKDFENDVKEKVLYHLKELSYNDDNYTFVIDYSGRYLSHARKDLIGLNAEEAKDIKDYKIILDAIKTIKNKPDGNYITYIQNKKLKSGLPTRKISFVRGVENWQWLIGKGFYEDDIILYLQKQRKLLEDRFEESITRLVIITLILTIVLSSLSFSLSKLLETRFKKYQDEIKTNLNQLTKQHNIMAHQSKMAALGNMIGNIAHQWRQPLSIISTAATGIKLKKEIGNLSDEELYNDIEYINNSAQYLSKTIDDFRNFFSTNKEKKDFSIKEAFDATLNIINAQFKNKNIEIIEDILTASIYGMKNELIQVLINVLNNSRDELIKTKSQRRLILIKTYEKEASLFIEIKDNAGGVPKEIIQHIFEPYFTTKHQSQGTGIGLYMSEEIIQKHFHGSISMENIELEYDNIKYKGAKTSIIIPVNNELF